MKSKYFIALFFFTCAVICGMITQFQSWGGVIYISNSQILEKNRNPAAIRKVFDFSQLEGSALKMRSQRRLIEDANVTTEKGKVTIELGHFVTKGDGNRKVFACDFYEHVNLTFKAEGMATGGEIPTMIVEAPCRVSSDLNKISSINIPVNKILNEKPSDMVLSYDESSVSFHFENIGSSWPKNWVLRSVKLSRDNHPGDEIEVDDHEIKDITSIPISMKW
jgi:hypothetical protein